MKNLVLITSSFPYGSRETFLETEIQYLCKAFNKVSIVSMASNTSSQRTVPDNCEIIHFTLRYTKATAIKSLSHYFHPIVKEERKIIQESYQQTINSGILKTLLVSFERGRQIANFLLKHFSKELDHTIFYSYWCDDTALGIAIAHQRNNKVKGVSRIHAWDVYFSVHSLNYLPFRKFILEHLKQIYSISKNGKKAIQEEWKLAIEKVIVSRLGILNDNRINYSSSIQSIKIVSCSNIIPIKRVSLIAESLRHITDLSIEWTHFGDGILMEELKEQISYLPKNILVHLPGIIPNKDIYTAYASMRAQIFINVSSSEGIPVSIMEAMSFGIPCIATDVGGNGEIVNNENGILLSSKPSVSEIKEAILELINNHSTKSEAAYLTWKEKYNAEINYPEFNNFLKSL